MGQSTTIFVGLDVHKGSIDIALAEGGPGGEVRKYGTIGGELLPLDKLVRKLRSAGAELYFVDEAGPRESATSHLLTAPGFPCAVVAPSTLSKRSGERIKTDGRDAVTLTRWDRTREGVRHLGPATRARHVRRGQLSSRVTGRSGRG